MSYLRGYLHTLEPLKRQLVVTPGTETWPLNEHTTVVSLSAALKLVNEAR